MKWGQRARRTGSRGYAKIGHCQQKFGERRKFWRKCEDGGGGGAMAVWG